MSARRYLVLAVVTLFAAFGDVCLKRGMRTAGSIGFDDLGATIRAVGNPWVVAGILLLLVFFAAYLHALSWADLTFVLPAAAMSYVVLALLSRYWLGEHVSLRRWIGIFLIVGAVGFVTRGSGAVSTTPAPAQPRLLPNSAGVGAEE